MANKIQLRRDTTANWTRVNPILDDGEPGLEIDTNKVKYGDGSTAWSDLDYASGGGGVNLEYAAFQEGVSGPPSDTNITSLTGNTGTAMSITSDVWSQLMWVPDTSTVTIDDIDFGPSTYTWAYVDDTGFTIEYNDSPTSYQWKFDTDGRFSLPGYVNLPLTAKLNSGGIGVTNSAEFGTEVTLDPSNNVSGSQVYMGAGTAESRAIVNIDGHSLMYIGVENPGFAGMVALDPGVTSEYGIQVGSNSKIEIGAVVGPITTTEYVAGLGVMNESYSINGLFANANVTVIGSGNHGWTFNSNGNLTVPGEIHSEAGTGNVTLQASDGSNPRNFVFNTDGSISLPALASGGQGAGAFDATNNVLALNNGDTVDFAEFSGMILVNSHNAGGVTLYLCGGGGGNAVAIGDSKAGNSVGSMAHNSGIVGYTFTADETGDHTFCAIRTRTVA